MWRLEAAVFFNLLTFQTPFTFAGDMTCEQEKSIANYIKQACDEGIPIDALWNYFGTKHRIPVSDTQQSNFGQHMVSIICLTRQFQYMSLIEIGTFVEKVCSGTKQANTAVLY